MKVIKYLLKAVLFFIVFTLVSRYFIYEVYHTNIPELAVDKFKKDLIGCCWGAALIWGFSRHLWKAPLVVVISFIVLPFINLLIKFSNWITSIYMEGLIPVIDLSHGGCFAIAGSIFIFITFQLALRYYEGGYGY